MLAGAETTPQVACRLGATLGEGPVWDAGRACLWFVDIKGHKLHRFDPAAGICESIDAPEEPGWVFPLANGGLLVGAKAGVHRFADGAFAFLHAVEQDLRLNDAAVHPDGSVWLGTMDNAEEAPSGGYYRLHQGSLTALSPDGGTVYLVDTLERVILSAPVDDDGHPETPRLFARIPEGMGYPDGPVVDSAGAVWVGLSGGWGVARFGPDGTFLGRVEFPVANVTKIAFGGADLTTVYATTARKGLSEGELAAQPAAGDLFSFTVGVPGILPRHPVT